MKRFVCLTCVVMLFFNAWAQDLTLHLSTEKTTSLIFPSKIIHVDRGRSEVLVEQVKDAPNILLVKAGSKDLPETNLSIVTEDGSLYSFRICYADKPENWVYQVPQQKGSSSKATAEALLDNPPTIKGIHKEIYGVAAAITGIYVKDNQLYFQVQLRNDSPLDYDIDFLRFFLHDKQQTKRTAVQEIEYSPFLIAGPHTSVKAGGQICVVVVTEKITLNGSQNLWLQVGEKGGNRHLQLKVKEGQLSKASPIPQLQ